MINRRTTLRHLSCIALLFVQLLGGAAAASDEGDQTCAGGQCSQGTAPYCEQEVGVDYPADAVDGDIKWEVGITSPEKCCELCKEVSKCKYWTLHPERQVCWLKKGSVKPFRALKEGLISGIVKGRKKKKDLGADSSAAGKSQPVEDEKEQNQAAENKKKKQAKDEKDNKQAAESEKKRQEDEKEKKQAAESENKKKKEKDKEKDKKKKKEKPATNAGAPPPPARNPQRAKQLFNEGYAFYKSGKQEQAIPLLSEASELDGRDGNIDMYLGMCCENRGRFDEAIKAYEGALVKGGLSGNNKAMCHNNLGLLYRDKKQRHDDAERQYKAAIAAAHAAGFDGFWHAHKNLGRLYEKNGRAAEAISHTTTAATLMESDALRFYAALILPYVYADEADIDKWRSSFIANLRALATAQAPIPWDVIGIVMGGLAVLFVSGLGCCFPRRWKRAIQRQPPWLWVGVPLAMVGAAAGLHVLLAKKGIRIEDPFHMEGVPQYYLSYHGRNDVEINSEISALFRASTPSVAFTAPHIAGYAPPAPGRKIRVGFFSYYFRDHSVSKMIMGLLEGLDTAKVHAVLFNVGKEDAITNKLRSHVSKYEHLFGQNIASVQQAIAKEELDVLVIAEIGMDPHSYAIAHGRLAPVQLAMHGHASTSGIATLDYYVSYEGFSEPDAQRHYSERLLVLPGLTPLTRYYDLVPFQISSAMSTPEGVGAFRDRFKIPRDATVYACLQTIFKVSPKLDVVAKRLLAGDPKAVVLMKELPMTDQVGKLVKERMRKTLTEAELRRIVLLPPLNDQDYQDTFKAVDVIFDSFPFGGHTSTLDAFSAGVPVVTLPTDLMSGRCTQGFYHTIGLPELIAGSFDEYVEITLKVGTDKRYRSELSAKISAGMEVLKKDKRSVEAWNTMLQDIVHGEDRVRPLLAPISSP